MFCGKTEELIRRLKRAKIARQRIQCFKPVVDNRYQDGAVVSHNKNVIDSSTVKNSKEILTKIENRTHVIGIDEAQFFDKDLPKVAGLLADRGYRVILAGLDQDYMSKPFGPMPILLSIAERVTKIQAICVKCGRSASKTYKLKGDMGQVEVGGSEKYEARCRRCYIIGMNRRV